MKIYNNIKKIYGPYKSKKDNRLRVVIVLKNGVKKTVSYPKFKMEQHLNRYLKKDESVDHIDQNVTNNDITNFKIIKKSIHSKIDIIRNKSMEFNCPKCNEKFILSGQKLHNAISNSKRGKVGPFCNKSCAGLYGSEIQNNKINKITPIIIKPTHYTLHKEFHENLLSHTS